jgi:hypothetical protein
VKVFRFHGHRYKDDKRQEFTYAYVRFNLFERLFFRRAIVALAIKHDLWFVPGAPGPLDHRAQFILNSKPTSGDRRAVEAFNTEYPDKPVPSYLRHWCAIPLYAFYGMFKPIDTPAKWGVV